MILLRLAPATADLTKGEGHVKKPETAKVGRMQNYDLWIRGECYRVRGDDIPTSYFGQDDWIERSLHKGRSRPLGPNWNGFGDSLAAALEYESIRDSTRWVILRYLILHNHEWISGRTLEEIGGTEALRRVRELRRDFGWPIEDRSRGKGVWDYRLNAYPKRRPLRRLV